MTAIDIAAFIEARLREHGEKPDGDLAWALIHPKIKPGVLRERAQRWAACLLAKHGYNPDAEPSGMSSKTGSTETWAGARGVLLRYWVCELDGILIDGHAGSDLDPGSTECIHCGKDWMNP